ncbi:MAG: ABC transporter permease [Nitrospirae bacterium]|nr:ABC transporter permease [Nitrospirota bacterium]
MRIFIFALQTALRSLWHEKWINLLTVLSISIGLLILSAFMTITLNIDFVLKRWSRDFGLVVYMKDGLSKESEDALKNIFEKDPDVEAIKYIPKEQALQELRLALGPNSSILEGFENNPLPSSFELSLKREALKPELVERKAEQIKQMNGVEDVEYGEKWLSSLNTLSGVLKIGSLFLGSAVFIAIVFVTYSTIKIFFYRRKDEIETLKLLGATRSFIRLPFLLEGLLIGVLGGAASSLVLYGLYAFVIHKAPDYLPSVSAIMLYLPLKVYVPAPLAGAVTGFIGSFIAVGKIRY